MSNKCKTFFPISRLYIPTVAIGLKSVSIGLNKKKQLIFHEFVRILFGILFGFLGLHCWYIEPRNREKSLTLF